MGNIHIISNVEIDEAELEFTFIRSPGPGGQNVNKVATAVQLRFNILHSSSLSDEIKERLCRALESKLTKQGEIIIKATSFRTQERNKMDALERLQNLLQRAATPIKKRKKTKPTFASKQQRLSKKKLHGKVKSLRRKKFKDE